MYTLKTNKTTSIYWKKELGKFKLISHRDRGENALLLYLVLGQVQVFEVYQCPTRSKRFHPNIGFANNFMGMILKYANMYIFAW